MTRVSTEIQMKPSLIAHSYTHPLTHSHSCKPMLVNTQKSYSQSAFAYSLITLFLSPRPRSCVNWKDPGTMPKQPTYHLYTYMVYYRRPLESSGAVNLQCSSRDLRSSPPFPDSPFTCFCLFVRDFVCIYLCASSSFN